MSYDAPEAMDLIQWLTGLIDQVQHQYIVIGTVAAYLHGVRTRSTVDLDLLFASVEMISDEHTALPTLQAALEEARVESLTAAGHVLRVRGRRAVGGQDVVIDLIAPEGGFIPAEAVHLMLAAAVAPSGVRVPRLEHLAVLKALAWANGRNQHALVEKAARYEDDVMAIRDHAVREGTVLIHAAAQEVIACLASWQQRDVGGLLSRAFGWPAEDEHDPSFG